MIEQFRKKNYFINNGVQNLEGVILLEGTT
jgi:hypothetical protein